MINMIKQSVTPNSSDNDDALTNKLIELVNSNPHMQMKAYTLAAHEILSRLIKSFDDLQSDLRTLRDLSTDAENNKEMTREDRKSIDTVLEEVDLELDDYKEEVDVLKSRIKNTIENLRSVLPILGIEEVTEEHAIGSLAPTTDMFNSRKEFLEAYKNYKNTENRDVLNKLNNIFNSQDKGNINNW